MNADKQHAFSLARAKRVQANNVWKYIDPLNLHVGKDIFFKTSYNGNELQVLRDGTIELHETGEGADDLKDIESNMKASDAITKSVAKITE